MASESLNIIFKLKTRKEIFFVNKYPINKCLKIKNRKTKKENTMTNDIQNTTQKTKYRATRTL